EVAQPRPAVEDHELVAAAHLDAARVAAELHRRRAGRRDAAPHTPESDAEEPSTGAGHAAQIVGPATEGRQRERRPRARLVPSAACSGCTPSTGRPDTGRSRPSIVWPRCVRTRASPCG